MGRALYRTHRPKSLKEVVGQDHITKTLEQALKQGRISHAYLFTGPRGVGKTSVARILAHEINNLPYTDDQPDVDIIEIDAASNRRIDEIRDLREKVYVAPVNAKYKVYIIDEVHMLTKEAFNALLKTLEEPPEHVVFILATTDAHKLPETIISRTQRFSFRPVSQQVVQEHLKQMAKLENLKVSDAALELLAEHGEGSFRDSISLLDQATSHGNKVELEDVESLLGIPPDDTLEQLLMLTSQADGYSGIIQALDKLFGSGYPATVVAKRLSHLIRQQLIDGSLPLDHQKALELLSHLVEVPASHDPERALELALLAICTVPAANPSVKPQEAPITIPESKSSPKSTPTDNPTQPFNASIWPEVLKALKQKHNTLYGVVRMAQPEFTKDSLRLSFAFSFHQKRLSENSNHQKLVAIIKDLTGQTVKIDSVIDKGAKPPQITVEADNLEVPAVTDELSTISNIFGNAEVLES